MSTIYVRATGNDSTGTGAYDKPYLTIQKGVSVAAAMDTVDVGEGNFLETTPSTLTVPLFITGVPGKTHWQMSVLPGGPNPSMIVLGSALSALNDSVVVANFFLEPGNSGLNAICKVQGIPAGHVFLVRNVVRYLNQEYLVRRDDTDDRHVVILNNVHVPQVLGTYAGKVVSDKNTPAFRKNTLLINNIFNGVHMVVDDTEGERGVVSNFNCYWMNERDFRFGTFGLNDIQADPKFVDPAHGVFTLQTDSPCRDSGLDVDNFGVQTTQRMDLTASLPFGDGRIRGAIEPTDRLNWGAMGTGLDMGATEYPVSDTKRQVNNFKIHTLIASFAPELDIMNSLLEYLKEGKSLEGAEMPQLQERWGRLMNVIRPLGFTRDDYEHLILVLLTAFDKAPAFGGIARYLAELFDIAPVRRDYHRVPRWRLGNKLKIIVPDPGGHPHRVEVTAGRFQLLNQWWDFPLQTIDLADGVWLLAAAPFDASLVLANHKPKLLAFAAGSDEIIPPDVDFFYNMRLRFTRGSKHVQRVSVSPVFSTFQRGYSIQVLGYNYFIDSITDDTNLFLSEEWPFDDQILTTLVGFPMYAFGFVTVEAGAITRLVSHSRLGSTAFADSFETRMNTSHLQIGGLQNATVFSEDPANLQILSTLNSMRPVSKLMYVSFQDDGNHAVIMSQDPSTAPRFAQPFTEDFASATWDVSL